MYRYSYGSIGNWEEERAFSVTGIEKALEFFALVPVPCRIVAFIPSSYVRIKPSDGSRGNAKMSTDEIDKLEMMVREAAVSVVPTGDHDDAYILSYARTHDGYIVSNDLFNDHIHNMRRRDPQLGAELSDYLDIYRCGYTFVHGEFVLSPDSELAVRIKTDLVYFNESTTITAVPSVSAAVVEGFTNNLLLGTSNGIIPNSHSSVNQNQNHIDLLLSDQAYLSGLDQLISTARNRQIGTELTYLLLARAHAFVRLGSLSLAQIDLNFILSHIDGSCTAASEMLRRILEVNDDDDSEL